MHVIELNSKKKINSGIVHCLGFSLILERIPHPFVTNDVNKHNPLLFLRFGYGPVKCKFVMSLV